MAEDYITDPKGHVWKTLADDDETIDIFAYDQGFHNGPGCIKCGFSFCHHCPVVIPECLESSPADPSATGRFANDSKRTLEWLLFDGDVDIPIDAAKEIEAELARRAVAKLERNDLRARLTALLSARTPPYVSEIECNAYARGRADVLEEIRALLAETEAK